MESFFKHNKFWGIFQIFFDFCIVGWLYEVVLCVLYGQGFVNRGFLFGPYLPIYGFGTLLLLFALKKVINKSKILTFFLIILLTTVLEYASSYVLEVLFNQRWWDYSENFMNINGRVCLSASVRFGLGGMLILYVLVPLFGKIFSYMPKKAFNIMNAGLLVLVSADFVYTLYSLLG